MYTYCYNTLQKLSRYYLAITACSSVMPFKQKGVDLISNLSVTEPITVLILQENLQSFKDRKVRN